MMLGLNHVAEDFSLSSLLLASLCLIVSAVCVVLFVRQEKREPNPILDLTLLKSTPFLAANLYNLTIGARIFGVVSFIPLYATSVYQLSTLVERDDPHATLAWRHLLLHGHQLAPQALGLPLAHGVGGEHPGGLHPLAGGPRLPPRATARDPPGSGGDARPPDHAERDRVGIALPASNNACIELMPAKVATITGLRGMFRYVGGALGVSVTTLILHSSPTAAAGFRTTFLCSAWRFSAQFPSSSSCPQEDHEHERATGKRAAAARQEPCGEEVRKRSESGSRKRGPSPFAGVRAA